MATHRQCSKSRWLVDESPRQVEPFGSMFGKSLNSQCLGGVMTGVNDTQAAFVTLHGCVMWSLADDQSIDTEYGRFRDRFTRSTAATTERPTPRGSLGRRWNC